MKKIDKKKLDELINLSRETWTNYTGESKVRIEKAEEMERESNVRWLHILYLLDSVFAGFAPNADNETIYAALKLFGWDVVEDVEVNPTD